MSDRNLLEVERAFKQTLLSFAQRLKRLELHAWGGAVRSTTLATFDGVTEAAQTVINLPLTSGRWIILQRAYCEISVAAFYAQVHLLSRTATQVIADTEWQTGDNFVLHYNQFTDFGEITLAEADTVQLQVYGVNIATAAWTNFLLMAIPV